MFKNYMLEAFRNIKKNKEYSFVSILGLTIGIACFILVFMWIHEEIYFDMFHKNSHEIYRIVVKKTLTKNTIHSVGTPNPLGPTLKNEFPEIINFTRTMLSTGWVIQYEDKKFFNSDITAYGDPSFFDIFTFPFIKGNPKTALNDPNSVVITENFAKKYFGDEDPMNKVIKFTYENLKVSGVMKNIPKNSHIQFDCILPIKNTERYFHRSFESWQGLNDFYTYIQVNKGTSQKELEKKIINIIKKNDPQSNSEIYLQPLKDIHLKSKYEGDYRNHEQSNIMYVYILSTLALSILCIACFNYMTLSTVRLLDRAKGISIRKAVGASRMDIIKQFLGESLIFSFIAFIFAVILVYFLLPLFNVISGKQFTFNLLFELPLLLQIIGFTFIIGIISGIYPSFTFSAVSPMNIMKKMGSTSIEKGKYLRKSLIFLQFGIAIILILSTIIIYVQMNFIKTKDLGFNTNNVYNFLTGHQFDVNFAEKKSLFMSNPNVLDFCMGGAPLSPNDYATNDVSWEGKNPEEQISICPRQIDYGYIEFYGIKIIEGRSFSKTFSMDSSAYIINETAAKNIGLTSPIGKKLRINGREGTIIGIVKDYHHLTLYKNIMPVVLMLPFEGAMGSVRINPLNIPETLKYLENTWNKINRSPYPFTGNFLDEKIADLYKAEKRMGMIGQFSTIIALLISCLGLFGLASYTSRQRTKEIGLRKVSGATVSNIVWLISKEFMKWVGIAIIIALPTGWYIMNSWLQKFAYRTEFEWWMFVLTSVIALAIAFFTISFQVIKAARANPVDSLRYE